MVQKDTSQCHATIKAPYGLLSLAVFLALFEISKAEIIVHENGLKRHGANVCEDKRTRKMSYSFQAKTFFFVTYTTKCGWFGWGRCKRSREVTKYKNQQAYKKVWDVFLKCCDGWGKRYGLCQPLCDRGCKNFGRCVRPNTCKCRPGWTGVTCGQDVNECYPNNGGCQHGCINRLGNPEHWCSCRPGYKGNPRDWSKCLDIDECKLGSICSCSNPALGNPCEAKCINSPGSYSCTCGEGYHIQHKTMCTDDNECAVKNGGCSHYCLNLPGRYRCECQRGFRLDSQLKLCRDVNECDNNNGNCQHTCQNLYGRHRCLCRDGYSLDSNEKTCSDIDECELGEDNCDHYCENIPLGRYRCYCDKGFELSNDNKTCIDVNECSPRKISGSDAAAWLPVCHHKCFNFEGGFECSCRNGYKLMYDMKRCQDIDECVTESQSCEQICHNTDGSYRCSCREGFALTPEGRSCEALPCENILPPSHGRMLCSGLVTYATCTFTCDTGYDLVGSKSRTCLPTSGWSGNLTSCKAKQCMELRNISLDQTILLPCYTSLGSTCHFGCRPGFFLKGDGHAKCIIDSKGGGVSWSFGQFSCKEIRVCHQNPCRHGGKCLALDRKSFRCNCLGTGYKGSLCQTGVISTPIFPKLHTNMKSGTLHLKARPSYPLQVSLHSCTDLRFHPPSLEFHFSNIKAEFVVKTEKSGIHVVSYSVGGESKDDFQTPERSVLLVAPDVLDRLPREELPLGCKERVTERNLECELRLLSTAPWIGTPASTSGIVHLLTSNNRRVPVSLVGLNLNYLNVLRDKLINIAVAKTVSPKEFKVWHQRNGTCHPRVSNTDNLLSLMWSDAFPSSFMQALTDIAPEWLQFALDENSDAFDIQNIAVNFAPDSEHCSGFPFTDDSIQVFYRPAVNYNVRIARQEIALIADGTTCLAIDICQSALFVHLPEWQASVFKNSVNLFRNMEAIGFNMTVDSIGLFDKMKTSHFVKRIIWNGIKLTHSTSFHYNVWLKGSLEWKMRTQSRLLFVTMEMTGEAFINYREINALFADALTHPVEVQLNGTGILHVKGRVLRKDLSLILPPVSIIGKAVLGGQSVCGESVQGVFLTSKESVQNFFKQSPFSSYIRPKETEPLRLAILVSLRERNLREGYKVESNLHGISVHLRTKLCMEKLCFNDLILEIDVQDEYNCHGKSSSVSIIRARGKVLKNIPSSINGNIITIIKHSEVKAVFPLESDLVSVNFVAKVNLFNISQVLNVTLQNRKLWFEMEGEMFQKYFAKSTVIAETNEIDDWTELRFQVHGSCTNTSQLSKLLQKKVTDLVKYLAERAAKKVQNVKMSQLQAKQRINWARALVRRKKLLLNIKQREKQRKYNKLKKTIKTYGEAKRSLNSSLEQFLLKNKQMCEYQVNCKYIEINTCIPTVCPRKIRVQYFVTKCIKTKETYVVAEVVKKPEEPGDIEVIKNYITKIHSNCNEKKEMHMISRVGEVISFAGDIITASGAAKIGFPVTAIGFGVQIFGTFSESILGCHWYLEKILGSVKTYTHKIIKHEAKEKNVETVAYECSKEIKYYNFTESLYECCPNENRGKIKFLDPKCVFHNAQCQRNLTDKRIMTGEEEKYFLRDFEAMKMKARRVVVAQLEMSKAKANFDFADNQLKIALAILEQHEHVKNSINITTVTSRERLGLKLAQVLKSANGKPLVTVDNIKFTVSMTKRSTKTRFPVTASLKTLERTDILELLEFPMDFTNVNRSFTIASRLIVKALFGSPTSRRRRSAREDPISSSGGGLHKTRLSLWQHECLFAQDAHVYFSEVIDSVELFINSRKQLEAGVVASLRGLNNVYIEGYNKNYGPLEEIPSTFDDTLQSVKQLYLSWSSTTSWTTTLDDLRAHLDVLSSGKNLSECSGIQDCIDFFFDSLGESYETENHPRAIEIKHALNDLEKLINTLLNERPTMAALEGVIALAKPLIVQSKDDIILCSKKPSIERNSPVKVVITKGETIQLLCEAVSPIELFYVWYKNGEPLEDTNSTTLVLANATSESEGVYQCKVSNSRGSTMSNVTIVEVHQKPQITEQPEEAQVLVGEHLVLLTCNSSGIPHPLTEWFFIPIKGGSRGHIVNLNSTKPVLAIYNLTSESSGLYFCNISNMHGTVQSRKAKVDVLDFAPGVPRIAIKFGLSYCNETTNPTQESNFSTTNSFWKQLYDVLGWPSANIESRYFHSFPNASISFVLKGDDPLVPGNLPPTERLNAALNNFSLSRINMGKSLRKLYTDFTDGNFNFEANKRICVGKDSFYIGFLPQGCPKGTRFHENGFLCVKCAPGYYEVGNRTCEQCPAGTYQPEEGSTECNKCPFRFSLSETGAFRLSQCIDISATCRPLMPTTKNVQSPREKKQLYRSGDIIVLERKNGFRGIGNATRECKKGKWTSATDFYCKKTCLSPWTEFKKRCYRVTALRSYTWKGASAKCQLLQSHMLTIHSEEENNFAAKLVQAHLRNHNSTQVHVWLGLFKSHPRGEFQWVDGSPFGNYSNWSPGEPNNVLGTELCTKMVIFGNSFRLKKWKDIPCDTTRSQPLTVCEKPMREED